MRNTYQKLQTTLFPPLSLSPPKAGLNSNYKDIHQGMKVLPK